MFGPKTSSVTHPTAADPARAHGPLAILVMLTLPTLVIAANWLIIDQLGFHLLAFAAANFVLFKVLFKPAWRWAVKLMDSADAERRRVGYRIRPEDYAEAPQPVLRTIENIFRSAKSLHDCRANKEQWFGELDTDRVLYDCSEQAVRAAELNQARRKLKVVSDLDGGTTLRQTRVALKKIGRHLKQVDAELVEALTAATQLSSQLDEAERIEAQAQRRAEQARYRQRTSAIAHTHASDAVVRARCATVIETHTITDRVAAVSAGYTEVSTISRAARPIEHASTPGQRWAVRHMWRG